MSTLATTVNYLPSWKAAEEGEEEPSLRVLAEDGTVHFHDLRKVEDSGVQYLYGVNHRSEPTRAMLIGTGVHHIVLGQRPTARVVRFPGEARRGKEWTAFRDEHPDHNILTAPEWEEAEQIAAAVKADRVAREYLDGADYEVPLTWVDSGLKCSTTGIDIVQKAHRRIGDLKTTNTTAIDPWARQAFRFGYHCQMAWYRRGARANGIDVSGGMFLLGVDVKPPHEVVVLDMSEELIDLGDRTITLWVEKLRGYLESRQFPGRAQSAVPWTVPAWLRADDDEEEAS